MQDDILLKNALVLDVVAGAMRGEADVRIRNGKIVEIGERLTANSGSREIDIRGRVLMPGLCDAHIHVAIPINDFSALTKLSPYYVAARTIRALEGMLMRGFTTVRDAGGAEFGIARAAEEGLFPSPRILFCGKALSPTGGHGDIRMGGENTFDHHYYVPGLGRICDGVAAVRQAARDEIRRGAHHVKIMAGGGIASYTDPIDNDQFSKEEILAVVEEAEMANTYVMAHAYTARQISRAVQCGVRSVEHGNFIDDEAAALMAERNAFLVPTLSIYEAAAKEGLAAGMPPEIHAKIQRVVDVGPNSLEIAARHKIKMAYGTDLMGAFHRYQSNEFRIRSEVLPVIEVLRSATCYAAELFNMTGKVGIVAENANADLIVVDGNPLEDIGLLVGQGEHLPLIMKGGMIYKDTLSS